LESFYKLKINHMKIAISNLVLTLFFSLSYFYIAYKVLRAFFEKISRPLSHASHVLLLCSLLGFGIILYNISDIATNAFQFYAIKSQIGKGIMYYILFGIFGFLSSLFLFHISLFLVKIVTKENEKAELARNNYQIAGIHAAIFILLCLILSSSLASVAHKMIAYPRFPN